MTDRRLERNQRIAEILADTQYDCRSHTDADCEPNDEMTACKTCGRPMNETEVHIYRAL